MGGHYQSHLQFIVKGEGVAQQVEHRPFKPGVAGSTPATLTTSR